MINITFRPYDSADTQACMDIFEANCPEFFDPQERQDYTRFLVEVPEGYQVCEVDGRVLGAFGLLGHSKNHKRLNWILLDPQTQGMGIGSKIMQRVIHLGRVSETRIIKIAASQKSAPFFLRFGAKTTSTTKDGWGSGLDRMDMELPL